MYVSYSSSPDDAAPQLSPLSLDACLVRQFSTCSVISSVLHVIRIPHTGQAADWLPTGVCEVLACASTSGCKVAGDVERSSEACGMFVDGELTVTAFLLNRWSIIRMKYTLTQYRNVTKMKSKRKPAIQLTRCTVVWSETGTKAPKLSDQPTIQNSWLCCRKSIRGDWHLFIYWNSNNNGNLCTPLQHWLIHQINTNKHWAEYKGKTKQYLLDLLTRSCLLSLTRAKTCT